jgi:hypothetical protein
MSMTETETPVQSLNDQVAVRITDALLSNATLSDPDTGSVVLYPASWHSAYRDALTANMPGIVAGVARSYLPASGTSVPEGPPETVGRYLCVAWGAGYRDTFAEFGTHYQRAIGRWWLDNRAQFHDWITGAETTESTVQSLNIDEFGPDEVIPVGTIVRVLPNATTDSGGGVYWGAVTLAEVASFDATGPDVYLLRLEGGSGQHNQTVGRRFLRRNIDTEAPVAFIPDVVPQAEYDSIQAELVAERAAHRATRQRYIDEAQRLSDIANRVAEENDLCHKYDEFVEEVNGVNTVVILQPRAQDATFSATRRVRVTTWVTQTGTYSGTEGDEPEEDDFTWESIDGYQVRDAVEGDYDVDEDDSEDFEYEED